MNIVFTPTAWEQYNEWIKTDRKIIKRINELIKSIDRDGLLNGIGKPEALKPFRQNEKLELAKYIKMA